MVRRLVIAGVTGSIGSQALDVLGSLEEIEVVGVTAGSDLVGLLDAARVTGCAHAALASTIPNAESDGIALRCGVDSAAMLIAELEPDLVLNAIVGVAGLPVSVSALECGADLALANKESLVAGGDLVKALAEANGCNIIPVDSEHASLAQLLDGTAPETVESMTLTASGGPFRGMTADQLVDVTVDQALAHPTWRMGGKITIDSATMMNKGLEVIEAHHLFGVGYDRIGVVVHPQSIVHALVSLVDGMVFAHLGLPDMRAPIGWALAFPDRPQLDVERLDLASIGRLEFEDPDEDAFPALRLAREAGLEGGTAPAILNAANEVAVEAFLNGRIRFPAISSVVGATLEGVPAGKIHSLESVARADAAARAFAVEAVERAQR